MCIKPELRDIIVGDKSFKECESKKVVMCLPLTHITRVNSDDICSTYKCSDVKNLTKDLSKYFMMSQNREVLKSGVVSGYSDSELFITGTPQAKRYRHSFILRDVSFREDGSMGIIIETVDTIDGRKLADRLVCDNIDNLCVSVVIRTVGAEEVVADLISFRII